MRFKFKKSVLSVGSATLALSSVACSPLLGKIGKYDSENDGLITIQTTWSAGGKPIGALEDAVKNYNTEMVGTPGFMHVKIEHVEGGYGTIPSQIMVKIQSKDTKTLPNLFIDYPSAVGQIAQYNMVYDATTPTLQRSLFEEAFVKSNDKISGLPKGRLYSVPLSKSTEAMVYDKPLLKYLITKMMEKYKNSVSDTNANPMIKEILKTKINPEDEAEIKKQWGTIIKNQSVKQNIVNDNIFKDFTSLRDFVVETQPLFTNPGGANILGIDSPSNYLYLISSLLSKNKDSDFLMEKNVETDFVDYNFIKKNTSQKTTFTKAYNEYLYKPINSGAMWVGGGGAYGSARLSKHQMAISIGSSAGLWSSTSKKEDFLNKKEVAFTSPPNKLYSLNNAPKDGFAWNELTSSISQGPSFNTVWVNKAENEATKKFLNWFYTKDKSKKDSVVNEFSKKSQYIVPLKGVFQNNSIIGQMVSNKTYEDLWSNLWGLKMAYETIRMQLDNNKLNKNDVKSKIFEPPIDDSTGTIRKIIDSKIKASANSFNSGGSAYSAAQIWNKIHRQAIIDNIINGSINQTKYNYPKQMNRNFSDINWKDYQYVDATIESWTDGDTPNVIVDKVHAISQTSPVNQIKQGDKLAIRISGIDTPEAHVKLDEIKRSLFIDGKRTTSTLDETKVIKLIDQYRAKGTPLAVFSNGHYNELHYKQELDGLPDNLDANNWKDKEDIAKWLNTKYGVKTANDKFNEKFAFSKSNLYGKYTDWKNIYVDIQTPDLSDRTIGYDPIEKDTQHDHDKSFYDLRKARLDGDNDFRLITDLATTEGHWGYLATKEGEKQMPKGTKVRIATDGNKSYDRIVGSIFYGDYLEKNWSVEILRKGFTMPFVGDPSAVTEPKNILWENGQAIADMFNYVKDNKIGLFEYSASEGNLDNHLKWMLSIHGVTKYTNLLHHSKESTIYDYMMYRNPDKSKIGVN